MTITREQVADLREGDVVELTRDDWRAGTVVRGPLRLSSDRLYVGSTAVRYGDGAPLGFIYAGKSPWSLTVVSRAPRPLYVNHPRTEPVPGDVVREENGSHPAAHTWHYLGGGSDSKPRWWRFDDTRIPFDDKARLRLLVDGETGQVVP